MVVVNCPSWVKCLSAVGANGGGFPGFLPNHLKIELAGRDHLPPNARSVTEELLLVMNRNVPKHVVVQERRPFWHSNPSGPFLIGHLAPVSSKEAPGNFHVEQVESLVAPGRLQILEVEIGNGIKTSRRFAEAFRESHSCIRAPNGATGRLQACSSGLPALGVSSGRPRVMGTAGSRMIVGFVVRHMFWAEDI